MYGAIVIMLVTYGVIARTIWAFSTLISGWKILFVPDVEVLHYQGTCSRARPIFVAWHKHRGMLRFYRKFFLGKYPVLLAWLVQAGVWLRFTAIVIFYGAIRLTRLPGGRNR